MLMPIKVTAIFTSLFNFQQKFNRNVFLKFDFKEKLLISSLIQAKGAN